MGALILDTDIGTDIDDAFALIYLLKKGCTLSGITTVYRNARRRAKLCKAVLASMGLSAPEVYAGIDLPFVQDPASIEPASCKQHYDENGRYIPPQCSDEYEGFPISSLSAVDFIIGECRRNERTDILAIGALTNIAAALRIAPEIGGKIRLTMMGGCLKPLSLGGEPPHPVAEWNILCDPEAAHIVFTSDAEVRMVGLDVTLDAALPEEVFRRLKASSVCPVLDRMAAQWAAYYRTNTPVLYDPVAAVSLFSDCLGFEKRRLRVGLEGKERGVVYEDGTGKEISVALRRRDELFYGEFLGVLGA